MDQPTHVFHLATLDQWATAQSAGFVAPPSLTAEGFIHCSTSEQLAGTIERHFAGAEQLALLRIDPSTFGDDLVWEEGRPGQLFPHVYRSIRVDEIIEVRPWVREPS